MRRVIVLLVVGVGLCVVAGALGVVARGSSSGAVAGLGSALAPAYPDVVADGSSGFDAVWTDRGAEIVTAHRSAATGRWSHPVALSGRVGQAQARIVGSAAGAAAAVWYVDTGRDQLQTVQASYRPSIAGAWEPAVTLARTGADWRSLQIGGDARGDAFAAWIDGRGVVMAEHHSGASAWSAPVTVERDRRAGDGSSLDLSLAVSPAGTIALVWERYLGGSTLCCAAAGTRDDVWLAVRPAGQPAWLPRVSLGLGGTASGQPGTDPYWYGPQIAINRHGTVFVAWQWPRAGQYRPRAAVITPADHWRQPRFVALPGPGRVPTIAGGAHGYSTVVWVSASSHGGLMSADLSPTGRVLDIRRVSGTGGTPRLADDGQGDLAGVWGEAAYRPAGHQWCPASPVQAAYEGYSVAISPTATGQVIWDYELGAHGVIHAQTLSSCRR